MKENFIPYGQYLKVLISLGDWKMLDANKIISSGIINTKYRELMNKLKKLEQEGLIMSFRKGKSSKLFYLTEKGKRFSGGSHKGSIDADYLNHENVVSRVLWELLQFSNLKNGQDIFIHEENSIDPDAIIVGEINKQHYKLAIEVELTQKSQKRVVQKFIRYGMQTLFDYTVYMTHNLTLFKAYQRILDTLGKKEKDQLILLFDENLIEGELNLNTSLCLYQNKKVNFLKLLKVKNCNKGAMNVH